MRLNEYHEWSDYDADGWADALISDMDFVASLEGYSDEEIKDFVKTELQNNIQYTGDDADWEDFLETTSSYFLNKLYSPII